MGKRRFRGHDPAAKARQEYEARRNPAAWGTNEAALQLAQNSDVHSVPETRTTTRRVQRFDCFATLKLSDHNFNAVRRFQGDLAEAYGVGDRDTMAEAVDGGSGSRELVTQRMIAATARVTDLWRRLSAFDAALLEALTIPVWIEGKPDNWHATVKRLRGLIDRDAQANCVRDLASSVREAYAVIDQGVRRAA